MTRINISRLFEISQYISTEAGGQLKDALEYLSEYVEVTVRALRNGLTIDNNFNATVKNVSLNNSTETVIQGAGTEIRTVKQIMLRKVVSADNYMVTGFGWKINNSGDVVVKATFEGSPTSPIDCQIAILY